MMPCKFYERGECINGNACHYFHDKSNEEIKGAGKKQEQETANAVKKEETEESVKEEAAEAAKQEGTANGSKAREAAQSSEEKTKAAACNSTQKETAGRECDANSPTRRSRAIGGAVNAVGWCTASEAAAGVAAATAHWPKNKQSEQKSGRRQRKRQREEG